MSSTAATPTTVKELTQEALQANKDHQYALKVYTERLEAELEAVDKLLAAAEAPDDEPEVDVGGHIVIRDAFKAAGPLPSDVSPEDHPFADDVAKRQQYMRNTTMHQMKASDLDALADAVRSENHRIYALEAQKRGQQPFVGLNDHPQSFFEMNKEGINWERVAQKVSAAGSNAVQRTAQECEIRWLGERHPDFDRSSWSPSEINRLKELVGNAKEGEVDWVDIAARLGTKRTPIDCMRHAITRKNHVWTAESDQRLLEMVRIYGTENWQLVARQVSEDATAAQCQNRYTRSLDPHLKRGPWSAEEDDQLRRAVEVYGRSWVDVCTFVPTRSNEQCRDRWQEALNPAVGRGVWTEEEEQALLAAHDELGDRWKEISQRIGGGRTDRQCRHRYSALMKRKTKAKTASPTPQASVVSTPEPVAGPSQPRAGVRVQSDSQPDSRADMPSTVDPSPSGAQRPTPKPKPRPRTKKSQPTVETQAGGNAGEGAPAPPVHVTPPEASTQQVLTVAQDTPPTAGSSGQTHSPVAKSTSTPEPHDREDQQPVPNPTQPAARGRGRPRQTQRKRAPAAAEAAQSAPKKRRTRGGEAPQEKASGAARDVTGEAQADTAGDRQQDEASLGDNGEQTASDNVAIDTAPGAATVPDEGSSAETAAGPQPPALPKAKGGRKAKGEPSAPTRQSARLRGARGGA